VPTTPLLLCERLALRPLFRVRPLLWLRLAPLLRLAERLRLCGLRALLVVPAREPLLERAVVLLERAVLLRLRDDADVLAFGLDRRAELFLVCLLPEAALLAISHPSSIVDIRPRHRLPAPNGA
jgi:hypothetical protein